HAAGAVAAVTFLANRWLVLTFVPTVPHFAVLFGFPLVAALVARARFGAWEAAALLVLVVLQAAVDVVSLGPAVLLPLGAIAAGWIARPATRKRGLRLLGLLAAGAVVLVALHAPYFGVAARNPRLA